MNAGNFFTRRILGLDYRVWGAMLSVCFFSLALFGYKQIRFNNINDQHCQQDTIAVEGKREEVFATCYLNRYVSFEVQSEAGAKVVWDFDDGTVFEKGPITT